MATREELKALVDQLPESSLEMVRGMMEYHINPPPPRPAHLEREMNRMQQRGQKYRKLVEQRFRETLRPGTIAGGGGGGSFRAGGMSGGGGWGEHEGTPFGRNSFLYWDGNALVQQTLQSFDWQDIEIMERFAVSPDRTKLVCTFELASGGRTVRHEEEFPVVQKEQDHE